MARASAAKAAPCKIAMKIWCHLSLKITPLDSANDACDVAHDVPRASGLEEFPSIIVIGARQLS
jgi:hypothetical protein